MSELIKDLQVGERRALSFVTTLVIIAVIMTAGGLLLRNTAGGVATVILWLFASGILVYVVRLWKYFRKAGLNVIRGTKGWCYSLRPPWETGNIYPSDQFERYPLLKCVEKALELARPHRLVDVRFRDREALPLTVLYQKTDDGKWSAELGGVRGFGTSRRKARRDLYRLLKVDGQGMTVTVKEVVR